SADKDMSRALIQLLTFIDASAGHAEAALTQGLQTPEVTGLSSRAAPSLGSTSDGFFACRRTRDGPTIA
ncbi:MAG: hypothetical protein ACHQ50_08170, partial [Fimbriimonadales bacterium]